MVFDCDILGFCGSLAGDKEGLGSDANHFNFTDRMYNIAFAATLHNYVEEKWDGVV